MHKHDDNRQLRLMQEKAVYRYTNALEAGDIETITTLWLKAEHDAVLEQMLLEVQAAYQTEETLLLHSHAAQSDEAFLFSPSFVEMIAQDGTKQHAPSKGVIPIMLEKTDGPYSPFTLRHVHRANAFVQSMAAVLVVAVLLGGFLALFTYLRAEHSGMGGNSSNGTWHSVPSLNGSLGYNVLMKAAALSPSDVWAVGESADQPLTPTKSSFPGKGQTLIEHWNGSQWQVVPSPNLNTRVNLLTDVATISSNDVWAVGDSYHSSNPMEVSTLIEHWNGSQWHIISGPNPGTQHSILGSITALSPNDVWAVGEAYISGGGHTLIEHWNGSQWQVVPSPNGQLQYNTLASVTAISPNDVWTAGESFSGNGGNVSPVEQTLIEHWNGSEWQVIPSPNPGTHSNTLLGMTALSSIDIWAVGVNSNNGNTTMRQPFIEHWNGSRWQVITSPHTASANTFLFGVTAISPHNAWAVGSSNGHALIEHWNGSEWHIFSSPNPENANTILFGITQVPDSSQLWAIGSSLHNASMEHTLTEVYS